jgi:hypothetical protein
MEYPVIKFHPSICLTSTFMSVSSGCPEKVLLMKREGMISPETSGMDFWCLRAEN